MMITLLAAAMTVFMLIATVVSMHQEAERAKIQSRKPDGFGFGH